jgi:hypothetical protein
VAWQWLAAEAVWIWALQSHTFETASITIFSTYLAISTVNKLRSNGIDSQQTPAGLAMQGWSQTLA